MARRQSSRRPARAETRHILYTCWLLLVGLMLSFCLFQLLIAWDGALLVARAGSVLDLVSRADLRMAAIVHVRG